MKKHFIYGISGPIFLFLTTQVLAATDDSSPLPARTSPVFSTPFSSNPFPEKKEEGKNRLGEKKPSGCCAGGQCNGGIDLATLLQLEKEGKIQIKKHGGKLLIIPLK